MKKSLLFPVATGLIFLLGCTCEKENPIEGFWDLQYYEWSSPDTTVIFKRTEFDRQIKVFGKEHFTFTLQYLKNDSVRSLHTDGGGGTYAVKGDTLIETIQIFPGKDALGHSMTYQFKISGDTLVQTGPVTEDVPDSWKGWKGMEIYTRLE